MGAGLAARVGLGLGVVVGGLALVFLGRGMAASDSSPSLPDSHAWALKGRAAGLGLAFGGGGVVPWAWCARRGRP